MTDELSIEGKQYISSKRAADLSGYAQDYVGQLARKGFIDAQRIGGLWYVFMDSLLKYKEKAEAYVPQPPQAIFKNESPDTLISFDGKDYVSAARAAVITGYHQDYVGQLARGGKILSRQVGNRWYVDREGILAHKEEKDNLLGAVQAQSVGIKEVEPHQSSLTKKIEAWEPLNYQNESGALMPTLTERREDIQDNVEEPFIHARNTPIPIRVVETRQNPRFIPKLEFKKTKAKRGNLSGNTIFYATLLTLFFAALITLTFDPFSFFSSHRAEIVDGKGDRPRSSAISVIVSIITKAGDALEPLTGRELRYIRG